MFKNMNIGMKIAGGFAIVIVLVVAIAVESLTALNGLHDSAENSLEASAANTLIIQVRRHEKDFLLRGDEKYADLALESLDKLNAVVKQLRSSLDDPESKTQTDAILSGTGKYRENFREYVAAVRRGEAKERLAELEKAMPNPLREAETICPILVKKEDAKVDARLSSGQRAIAIVGILSVLAASFIAFFITRSIVGPVRKGVGLAEALSRGDLAARIDVDQNDEVGKLAQSMRSMSGTLRDMIGKLKESVGKVTVASQTVESASGAISKSSRLSTERSQGVAAAAEETNASVHGIAAAMHQSTASVATVATAAEEMAATIHELSQSTARAREMVEKAVARAQSVSGRVQSLDAASRQIGQVTNAIAEISEQTKLLALNATIEAARAGEAGKGFAVVAGEIKSLALQTAKATSEIGAKISQIQQETKGAVEGIVDVSGVISDVGAAMVGIAAAIEEQAATTQDIARNVAETSSALAEVSTSAEQVSSASGEIARDVSQVAEATSEIDGQARRLSDSASDLLACASELDRLASWFKV